MENSITVNLDCLVFIDSNEISCKLEEINERGVYLKIPEDSLTIKVGDEFQIQAWENCRFIGNSEDSFVALTFSILCSNIKKHKNCIEIYGVFKTRSKVISDYIHEKELLQYKQKYKLRYCC